MAHTNSGSRNQVMPGARSMWIVAMKLTPVAMRRKARRRTRRRPPREHCVLENMVE